MHTVSRPSRQMSWQKPRQRVSLLADLAIRKENVSRKLAELRELHSGPDGKPLAQEKAAAKVGVSMRQWQRWEAGESIPYPRNLGVIAESFQFNVGEFYDEERPQLTVVHGDGEKIDQILAELERATEERAGMQALIDAQSELVQRQDHLLRRMETKFDALVPAIDAVAELLEQDAAARSKSRKRRAGDA